MFKVFAASVFPAYRIRVQTAVCVLNEMGKNDFVVNVRQIRTAMLAPTVLTINVWRVTQTPTTAAPVANSVILRISNACNA